MNKPMMVMIGGILFNLIALNPMWAADNHRTPTFSGYPVQEIYTGPPAKVDFSSDPGAKTFRTHLREGIREGANFAGSYTIVSWGCGTSCQMHAILSTKTGKVLHWFDTCGGEKYWMDSRLLIVNPDSNEEFGCKTEYYLWNGKTMERVK